MSYDQINDMLAIIAEAEESGVVKARLADKVISNLILRLRQYDENVRVKIGLVEITMLNFSLRIDKLRRSLQIEVKDLENKIMRGKEFLIVSWDNLIKQGKRPWLHDGFKQLYEKWLKLVNIYLMRTKPQPHELPVYLGTDPEIVENKLKQQIKREEQLELNAGRSSVSKLERLKQIQQLKKNELIKKIQESSDGEPVQDADFEIQKPNKNLDKVDPSSHGESLESLRTQEIVSDSPQPSIQKPKDLQGTIESDATEIHSDTQVIHSDTTLTNTRKTPLKNKNNKLEKVPKTEEIYTTNISDAEAGMWLQDEDDGDSLNDW